MKYFQRNLHNTIHTIMNNWFICAFCIIYFDVILLSLICIVPWLYLIVYDIFGIGCVTFSFVSSKCGLLVICVY